MSVGPGVGLEFFAVQDCEFVDLREGMPQARRVGARQRPALVDGAFEKCCEGLAIRVFGARAADIAEECLVRRVKRRPEDQALGQRQMKQQARTVSVDVCTCSNEGNALVLLSMSLIVRA